MRLATRRYGAGGRHVALVHGLGADGALWRGLSDRATNYTLDAFAGDLVDTLPTGLDLVVGHSLGGSVLERAVARLAPAAALYLDPGFRLGLPSAGLAGRLFWATAPVGLTVAALAQRRRSRGRPEPSARDAALRTAATDRFDRGMTLAVLRDVAHHPAPVAAPVVPSTLLLSHDAPAVVAEQTLTRLAALGWRVRRLPGIGHDLWIEDPGRTWDAVRDVPLAEAVDLRPSGEPGA